MRKKKKEREKKLTWAPVDEDGGMRNGNIYRSGHIRIAAFRESLPPCSADSGCAALGVMSGYVALSLPQPRPLFICDARDNC